MLIIALCSRGGLVESESGKAVVVVGRGESWAAGAQEGSKL